eukprot:1363017-Amphidinium_carterae.1
MGIALMVSAFFFGKHVVFVQTSDSPTTIGNGLDLPFWALSLDNACNPCGKTDVQNGRVPHSNRNDFCHDCIGYTSHRFPA